MALLSVLAQVPTIFLLASVALVALLLVGTVVGSSRQARVARVERRYWVSAGWTTASAIAVIITLYGLWWLLTFAWRGIWS